MKFAQSILLTLTLLLAGQFAVAQAAKDVNVVNGPVNPASVMIENGILNPVPVLDVTPASGELRGIDVWGADSGGGRTEHTVGDLVRIPQGKLLKIKGVSATLNGNADSTFYFYISGVFGVLGDTKIIFLSAPSTVVIGPDTSLGVVFQEIDDFPPMSDVVLLGTRVSPSGLTSIGTMRATVWGYLVDAPVQ